MVIGRSVVTGFLNGSVLLSFVGDDFFCFSCMGLSKDFLHVAEKKRKKKGDSFVLEIY